MVSDGSVPTAFRSGLVQRLTVTWWVTALFATGSELVGCAPGLSFAPSLALWLVLAFALSAIWTFFISVAAAGVATVVAWRRQGHGPMRFDGLIWVPPAIVLCVVLGRSQLLWGQKNFVRQDLAAWVMPIAVLVTYATIALFFYGLHLFTGKLLARLSRYVSLAVTLVLTIAMLALFTVAAEQIREDNRWPAALQAIAVLLVAAVASGFAPSLVRASQKLAISRLFLRFGLLLQVAISLFCLLFSAKLGPSFIASGGVMASLENRGMVSGVLVRVVAKFSDRDKDGVGGWFVGGDCDDSNPMRNPLAKEIPGNGVDEDCFEGDLTQKAVAEEKASRPSPEPSTRPVRNVIFITVDTLRADAVGFNGGKSWVSPNLDALAKNSWTFSRAYSMAPMTRRAFPALLSGQYPSNVKWQEPDKTIYTSSTQENVYVAETLAQAGFSTAMIVAFSYAQNGRFDQGFSMKKVHPASQSPKETNAHILVDDAISILKSHGSANPFTRKRLFLWMHFYEAHAPYVWQKGAPLEANLPVTHHQKYLSEMWYIDSQLGRLFEYLRSTGELNDTAIIFTSDHGEEFAEHGGKNHGDLYPEDLWVPLLIHAPGFTGKTIATPVSTIDMAPTILDFAGLPRPASHDGASLLPLGENQTPPRPLFAELIADAKVPQAQVAWISQGWLLMANLASGARQLFNLNTDPFAAQDLLGKDATRAAQLEAELRRFMALRIGPLQVTGTKKKAKPPSPPVSDPTESHGSDDE